MENLDLQLNEDVTGYLRVPYSFFKSPAEIGRKLSRAQIALHAMIYTFSCSKKGKQCLSSYSNFEEKLNLTRGTVARGIKALKTSGKILQDKSNRFRAAYRPAKQTKEPGFVWIDFYLYVTKFAVKGEKEPRYLKKSEIDILSLIKTHCQNPRGEGVFNGSVRGIEKTLNLSHKAVQDAIKALLRADLLFRPERGLNGHARSVYAVNERLLRRAQKKFKKQTDPPQAQKSAEAEAADFRSEFDGYYAKLRQREADRVAHFEYILDRSEAYRRANGALKALEIEMARAEVYGQGDPQKLEEKATRLKAERARAMADMNVSEADLRPHYRCRRCSDTGYLPDGKLCGCYPKGER